MAEPFRTFSDTCRVRILSAIVEKETNISALAKLVGVSESAVTRQLRSLWQIHIVRVRRDGKEVYYGVDDSHIIALFQQGIKHI